MILAASCMKRYSLSFYVDPAKRCAPWGVLKWEQQETERLCSLLSASSAAENKMLRKLTSKLNIEDGKCSLTCIQLSFAVTSTILIQP